MHAEQVIEQVESIGGELVFLHGKLKGRGLNSQTRALVKKHKAELIVFLQRKTVEPGSPSIFDTLLELNASDDLVESFIGPISNPAEWRRWEQIKQSRIQE